MAKREPEKKEYKPQKSKSSLFKDVKQWVVALQDAKDKSCYHDKNDYDDYYEAKEAADAWAEREGRPAVVIDRASAEGIVYRAGREVPKEEPPRKKGRKP